MVRARNLIRHAGDHATQGGISHVCHSPAMHETANEVTQAAYARRPLGFIAAFAPEAVRDELHGKLTATYAKMTATPYSDADRKRRLVEIERDVAQLERDEESAVRAAESAGMPIERRADAAPSVVLVPDRKLGVDAPEGTSA